MAVWMKVLLRQMKGWDGVLKKALMVPRLVLLTTIYDPDHVLAPSLQ